MTRPLAGGWLLICPADAGTVAELVREGARVVAAHRPLPRRAAEILDAAGLAAYDARSAAGTIAVQAIPASAESSVTVDQAAEVLGMSCEYVRRLCRTGRLSAHRAGAAWLIDPAAVAALAATRGE